MEREEQSGTSIVRGLRAATLGVASLLFQGMAPPVDAPIAPVIDRARRRQGEDQTVSDTAQLVMQQAAERSIIGGHRSHSSHYSSRSGGGGSYIPIPAYVPTPAPVHVPAPSTLRVITVPKAHVSIDGTDVGVSPTAAIPVSGTVKITVTHKLRGTIQKVVDVKEGLNTVTIDW